VSSGKCVKVGAAGWQLEPKNRGNKKGRERDKNAVGCN
jgi:hypothetical protein